jgi:hypothetical protein
LFLYGWRHLRIAGFPLVFLLLAIPLPYVIYYGLTAPMQALAAKFISGELELDTPVAREGSEFHPVTRVAAFARHVAEAKKAATRRHAKRSRRLVVTLVAVTVVVGAIGGAFFWREVQTRRKGRELEAQKLEAALAAARKRAESLAEPELVALVSLGSEDTVKIRQAPAPARKVERPSTSTAAKRPGAAPAQQQTSPEELAASCRLSQADIYGTLKRSLGIINVCIEDEKSRDTQGLLPPTLELEFVVQTSGRVTDFALNDRHYAKGPLNNCLIKAFNAIQFPASNGTTCPVTIPIKIGK